MVEEKMKAKCYIIYRVSHEWDNGKDMCQCGERQLSANGGESMPTGNSGISSEVLKLEQNYYEVMKFLAGEMIATLIIQNNKKLFDHMPPEWFSTVENWERQFREITNENPTTTNEFDFYELKPESVFKIIDGRYDEFEGYVLVKGSDNYDDKPIPFNAVDIYTGCKQLISDTVRVKLIK